MIRKTIITFLLPAAIMLSAGQAWAWGWHDGLKRTCENMGTPAYSGHSGWRLVMSGPKVCAWTKTVNSTTMGGVPGQYFCNLTANLNQMPNRPCRGKLRMTYTGNGIQGGKQACTELFGPTAKGTVRMGEIKVCNGVR